MPGPDGMVNATVDVADPLVGFGPGAGVNLVVAIKAVRVTITGLGKRVLVGAGSSSGQSWVEKTRHSSILRRLVLTQV